MSKAIYLLHNDEQVIGMSEKEFDSEDILQSLIANYPELLAGDQFGASIPRRFLLISREMGLPSDLDGSDRWAIDHLFVDQDAILTVVEVKRSSDTRIRREVVGQMLDYASNAVVYLPIEKIRARFERTHSDPEQRLREFLGDDVDYDLFWENVKTNLHANKIRLLFVADEIPAETRRIIEFLNRNMPTVEVLAVEVKQYVDSSGTLKTLVPRVMGQTAETLGNKSIAIGTGRQWNEASFFDAIAHRVQSERDVAKRIYEWANGIVRWGQGTQDGSFSPLDARRRFTLFAVFTNGKVEIPLPSYDRRSPFDTEEMKRQLISRLAEVSGIDLDRRLPQVKLSSLTDPENFDRFIAIFDWVRDQLNNH
jgi:hypothetical protein